MKVFAEMLVVASLFGVGAASGVTILVDPGVVEIADDGQCSLLEAINNANLDSQGLSSPGECVAGDQADRIVLPADSEFRLLGQQDIVITDPLFLVGNGSTLVVGPEASSAEFDALYFTVEAELTATELTLRLAEFGGDLSIVNEASGYLEMTDCMVTGTRSSGPLANLGTMVLTNTEVVRNSTVGGSGGITNLGGTLTLIRSNISQNFVTGFGGTGNLYNSPDGFVTILESTISRGGTGTQVGSGGGITNDGFMVIRGSAIFSNSARSAIGGGIENRGTLWLSNSTVTDNFGSALANFGEATVLHTTFSDSAQFRPGLENYGELEITGSIIADNSGPEECLNEGTLINGINLVEDGSCGAEVTGDPLLQPLAWNGGPTQTQSLSPGSPAIDRADPATCPDRDQRGEERRSVTCDLGAFEYADPDVIFQEGFEAF